MADLESLIRVRKYAVEQKQKVLADLYRQAQSLKDKRDALEAQLAIESEKARDMDLEYRGYFSAYANRVHTQIEEIDLARAHMEERIKWAQDDIRDAFGDMKKIEIIDERRKAEFLAELNKKEADLLDDIALDGFRRQES